MVNSKKILITYLGFLLFALNANVKAEDDVNNMKRFSLGVGFDAAYFAPVAEVSYRFHEYWGLRATAQYTISGDLEKIYAEEVTASDLGKNITANLKYKNVAAPVILDIYPFKYPIRIFAGAGYMKRTFIIKRDKKAVSLGPQIFYLAGIGYKGSISSINNLGYGLDIKGLAFNSQVNKQRKKDWRYTPTVVFTLNYDM